MSVYSQLSAFFNKSDFEIGGARFQRAVAEANKKMTEARFISKAIKECYPAALSPLVMLQTRAAGQVAFFKTYGVKATAKDWVKP